MISIYQQLRNISRAYKMLTQTQLRVCISQSPSYIWRSLNSYTKSIRMSFPLIILRVFSKKPTCSKMLSWPQNLVLSKHLRNQTWQWSGWTSEIPRAVFWQRTLSIVTSTLDDSLLPSKIPTWIQVFHSVRTVGSGGIRYLVVILISPGALSTMELTIPNTTEKKHGTT